MINFKKFIVESEDRIRGSVDLDLSAEGKEKVWSMAQKIKKLGSFDAVFCTPHLRSRRTAMEMPSKTPPKVVPTIRDMCFGQIEGMYSEDAAGLINDTILQQPDIPFVGKSSYTGIQGESFNGFKKR